ncbi:MAG: glycine cleavage system protein GcvH [Spirochaetales bacterium]|nr:glycine cleavage system protein GcvH [Spirochaetales bacterium]
MSNPENLKFLESHEWIDASHEPAVCGISDFAQQQLTDIVFVELPEPGKKVAKGDRVAVVESVKSVSDIYAPASGEIVEANTALSDSPELINGDAFGKGWIFKIKLSGTEELNSLLSKQEYDAATAGGAH